MKNKDREVLFKWKNDTLIISADEALSFASLIDKLDSKISDSGEFFKNTSMKIFFEEINLTEAQKQSVANFVSATTNSKVELVNDFNYIFENSRNEEIANPSEMLRDTELSISKEEYTIEDISNLNDANIHKGTIRSGQLIESKNHLVVIGDVNPSGEVRSGGSIYIFGNLKGIVHAGKDGHEKATITALQMTPSQIRIAGVISRAPGADEWRKIPEVAYLEKGRILVRPYSSSHEEFEN